MRMAGGFCNETCAYGLRTDKPIAEGEKIFEAHPDSPFAPDVMFLLGQAYETLYNQGLSPLRLNRNSNPILHIK